MTANDGTTTTGRHCTLDGYRVGAGVEEAIGRIAHAKLEYRHSNYGNARLEYANGANTGDSASIPIVTRSSRGSACGSGAIRERDDPCLATGAKPGRGACSGPFYV